MISSIVIADQNSIQDKFYSKLSSIMEIHQQYNTSFVTQSNIFYLNDRVVS